jgi:alkanesulfonate monooxygenase SsuD/methylene tetrahydromethanopterin reductase-like flavin-dependent oxidoreductase (luciferase family)
MIGGQGERKTLRLMAEHAEMANFTVGLDEVPRKLEVLAGHCATAGRDMADINKTSLASLFLGASYEEGVAKLDARLAPLGMTWATADEGFKQQLGARFVVGGPDEVGERCRAHREAGLDGLTFNMPTDGHLPDAVAFAGEVVAKALA